MWKLKAKDYLNEIDADAAIRNHISGKVRETEQLYITKEAHGINKPKLTMLVSQFPIVYLSYVFSFKHN